MENVVARSARGGTRKLVQPVPAVRPEARAHAERLSDEGASRAHGITEVRLLCAGTVSRSARSGLRDAPTMLLMGDNSGSMTEAQDSLGGEHACREREPRSYRSTASIRRFSR